jgi:transcriptional regulator with XRE-family HTH domain
LTPRCGLPVTPYERPGAPVPDKYAGGVADAIRQARLARGMTQQALASALGIPRRETVANWEAGLRYPEQGNAIALRQVLGITLGGPVCGRPGGHNGPCRSEASWRRQLDQPWRQKARAA